jgi:glycosyltransferase involved in cell wall biosynthesis
VIAAHNAETTIAETLTSVLAQTYPHLEVFVVDDGSSDRTADIVRSFVKRDRRVTLLQQQQRGFAAACNFGIRQSRGEFIAPATATDVWFAQKIEKQLQCMMALNLRVGLVYSWSVGINDANALTGRSRHFTLEGNVFHALLYCNFLGSMSVPLIRRCCFEQVGYYDPRLSFDGIQGCEDRDLYLRIAEHYEFRVVPEFLVGYRQVMQHTADYFHAMAKSHEAMMAAVKRRHPEIPAKFYRWSASNFTMHLASQSRRSGHHRSTLSLLMQANLADGANLLRWQMYAMVLKSLVNLSAQPIASRIWADRRAWLEFKHQLKLRFKAKGRSLTLSDIHHRVKPVYTPTFRIYDRIRWRRWIQVTG